jgi:hypothetical protein
MADDAADEERRRRVKPHGSGQPSGKYSLLKMSKKPAFFVAPNAGDKNTLHFTTWVEVKVVTRHRVPLKCERVRCYSAEGQVFEAKTDKLGIVRFDKLPLFDLKSTFEDLDRPAISLPDVLEEWNEHDLGDFEKGDAWRRHDKMVRFVPVETPAFLIVIEGLTEEQKFQHFMKQYTEHHAKYTGASPRDYKTALLRWKWGGGAVCNQHTNFFLGFWLNYNHGFTTVASRSTTLAQLCYDSSLQSFSVPDTKKVTQPDGTVTKVACRTNVPHRGYLDFLVPLDEFGKDNVDFAGADALHQPTPESESSHNAYKTAKQIRMTRFFDPDTLLPNDRGRPLFDTLGNFNVYAVSDIPVGPWKNQVPGKVKTWLKKNLTRAEHYIPALATSAHKQTLINAQTNTSLYRIVWLLEDEDDTDMILIKQLRALVNWDHHAGIMLKRDASQGGEPFGQYDDLWTFSADGDESWHPPIELKRLNHQPANAVAHSTGSMRHPRFLHLVLCRITSLQSGGYPPDFNNPADLPEFIDETDKDADDVKVTSLHVPRFIEWG